MKVIEDCWGAIGLSDCSYGAHLIDGSAVKIYVYHGVDVGSEMSQLFYRKNAEGYAGHCLLVFRGVKTFKHVVSPYVMQEEKVIWSDPIATYYEDSTQENVTTFCMGGGLSGFSAYAEIEIEAKKFELHILDAETFFASEN